MSTVTAKLREEFLAILPPTIYFFVTLHVIALIRMLLANDATLSPVSTMSIAVAALILGKSVLIADLLPFINRYPAHPLVYNIAWKSTIYLLMSIVIHYLERLFEASREAHGVVAGNALLLREIAWPHFWAVQILLAILIVIYCTTHEFARVIGGKRLWRLVFGPLPRPTL